MRNADDRGPRLARLYAAAGAVFSCGGGGAGFALRIRSPNDFSKRASVAAEIGVSGVAAWKPIFASAWMTNVVLAPYHSAMLLTLFMPDPSYEHLFHGTSTFVLSVAARGRARIRQSRSRSGRVVRSGPSEPSCGRRSNQRLAPPLYWRPKRASDRPRATPSAAGAHSFPGTLGPSALGPHWGRRSTKNGG